MVMITRWLVCFFLVLLSACTTYNPSFSNFPLETVRNIYPHYVPVRNGRIEYYELGQGSPIILIPGFATDISGWNRVFLVSLAKNHRVIVINNRNVGGSFVCSKNYNTQELAFDVSQLIRNLGLCKPAILGISMGGMIAQQIAISYPHQISHLILMNTIIAGHKSVHPNREIKKQLMEFPKNKLARYITAVNLFFPCFCRAEMAFRLLVERFQPQNYTEVNTCAIMPYQRNLIIKWVRDDLVAAQLNHLTVPTLILVGDSDIIIPPINSCILAKNIPHSYLLHWPEGGHAMIYQYPHQLADSIDQFVTH